MKPITKNVTSSQMKAWGNIPLKTVEVMVVDVYLLDKFPCADESGSQ